MYHYKDSGLDNVYLTNGYEQLQYGDETFVSIQDIDGLHRALSRNLVNKNAPLTGAEFRFLRVELGLSQRELGERLGVTPQAVAKWEKEQNKGGLPRMADGILRETVHEILLGERSRVMDELMRIGEQSSDAEVRKDAAFRHNQNWEPEPLAA